ncbi:MAG: exodeoxyribonuclease VII large subunit [Bdellovibrionales bacterium]
MTDDLFSSADRRASPPQPQRSNAPEMSVSDLALSLKRTIEDAFGRVRVRGELSRVKIHTSGHMYSDLKDENAVINAVCWRGQLSKLSVRPEEGLDVICTGKITTYPARSNYQLMIESMELAGEGALLKMLEERKKKLAAEGLFAPERKRAIPFMPRRIGVVTSQTGAVFHDIMHRIQDRFPCHVMLWSVPVQGVGAENKIAEAIRGFNAMPSDTRPDTMIVARGGGSLEDLMAFNEEIVVRAVAESQIPVISAVGHETDTTLIDYASDKRAPTPTGAAEMAVPERLSLLAQVEDDGARLKKAVRRILVEAKTILETRVAQLGHPAQLLDTKTQKLDHLSETLTRVFERFIASFQTRLVEMSASLRHPRDLVAEKGRSLSGLSERLSLQPAKICDSPKRDLEHLGRMLETLSFKATLERGYVVVRDQDNKPVTDPSKINTDMGLNLEYKGGKHIKVRAE